MNNREIIEHLCGVFPPLATPFNRRGKIDEAALRENLEQYSRSGLSGVLVAGSTGEVAFLTDEERLRLVEIARPVIKPPQLLLAGTGVESTAHTKLLSREAIARGADAVLLLPPAYYKPAMRTEVLEAHFRAVADNVRRPVLIYSIPQFTGFAMDPAMIGRLSRHPNVLGIKESSGDLTFDRAILRKSRKEFHVFMGSALVLPKAFELGARGAILSQANFEPQICVGLYEASRRGDRKTAEALRRRLMILSQRITGPLGIPGIKYALDLSGYHGGIPRPPLQPLSRAEKKAIEAALKEARAGLDA
ncbi:MAG: dihydrodipicolinate synthase family protein [Acidobacteriota bacterium]|nr:dihydrodipicolinate synthase family protein [Acidobacteriota bacterium]